MLIEDTNGSTTETAVSETTVTWQLDRSASAGNMPSLVGRAEFPGRVTIVLTITRNVDPAVAASHVIEIQILPGAKFNKTVADIPGVILKSKEKDVGQRLEGTPAKLTDSAFSVSLSPNSVDEMRNIDLMRTRDWMDIPIQYSDGKRAMLSVEKAFPSSQVFEEAFAAWGDKGAASATDDHPLSQENSSK